MTNISRKLTGELHQVGDVRCLLSPLKSDGLQWGILHRATSYKFKLRVPTLTEYIPVSLSEKKTMKLRTDTVQIQKTINRQITRKHCCGYLILLVLEFVSRMSPHHHLPIPFNRNLLPLYPSPTRRDSHGPTVSANSKLLRWELRWRHLGFWSP